MKADYFEKLTGKPEGQINLGEAALRIAADEYPKLDVASYVKVLDHWGAELNRQSAQTAAAKDRLEQINDWLFNKMQFTGNVDDYYDPKNSFLNDVIDRKKGIPITLSVIYLELAWRLGLDAAGIGFPGHFLVRVSVEDRPLYIDAFHQGNMMTVEGCIKFFEQLSDGEQQFQQSFLSELGKKQILTRMLRNLKGIYLEQKNYKKLIQVISRLIALNPDVYEEIRDRGIIHYEMQAFKFAFKDFETYLFLAPHSEDADIIRQYLEVLREYSSHLN